MEEVWKAVNVEFYGKYYEVSTHGRVRSIDREAEAQTPGREGKTHNYKGRYMNGHMNSKGYWNIELCVEGKRKTFQIHRLMGFTFLENPFGKSQIDHIDRNPSNNNINNLRWVTGCENQANRGIPKHNTSGELHINVLYRFAVRRNGKTLQKAFHTMEEALAYRKEILGF